MIALPESFAPAAPIEEPAPTRIHWGCHDTPFGPILVGMNDEGLWRIEFTSGYGIGFDLGKWQKEFPETEFIPDSKLTASVASRFSQMNPWKWGSVSLAVYGTAFQMQVWKAMLQVKPGEAMSFADIAALIGKPEAARAVGLAAAATHYPVQSAAQKIWENQGQDPSQKQRVMFLAAQSMLIRR